MAHLSLLNELAMIMALAVVVSVLLSYLKFPTVAALLCRIASHAAFLVTILYSYPR